LHYEVTYVQVKEVYVKYHRNYRHHRIDNFEHEFIHS
jgi:hypothetical protein